MVTIKRQSGEVVLSTPINEGAKRKFLLMKEDYITLPFSIENPVHFKIGDWVELPNETTSLFEVVDHQHPTFNDNTGGYDYQLKLEAYYMKWKNKIVKYSPQTGGREAAFHLTADPATQLGILLENLKALNYTYRGVDFTFSIDDSVEQSAKLISYNKTNLIDALNLYAQAWECEWWVTNSVIHLGRCEMGSSVDFELHKNVENMSRSETRQSFATRVYAFGGTRNIPTNYRPTTEQPVVNGIVQKRLMLPIGTPCIDAFPSMRQEEAVEDVVVFDDVYPRRVGKVDEVTTKAYRQEVETEDGKKLQEWSAYRFKDSGIDFSKKYILQGEELKIVFQSGSLNGMEFAVQFNPDGLNEKNGNEWNAGAQWYEIVRNEDYGRPLPDEVLKPKIGDAYILHGFDIKMVGDLYVPNAEAELKEKAERYVAKSKIDPSVYQCRMMSDTMIDKRGNASLYECGQRVTLINPTYFEESRPSRIIGYEYYLDIPYDSPIYTVGEVAAVGRIGQLEAQIQALTYKGQTYEAMGGGVYLITSIDRTVPSDSNAYSARRSHIEFLSRLREDTAGGHITFADGLTTAKVAQLLEGLTTADYVGGLTGRGAKIDKDGHAELDSLFVRKFIESSELRYNRVSVIQGEQWHAKGGGIIQILDTEAKRIQLKLEAGEHPTVAVGDLCKANYNTGTGFTTCYFKVVSVTPDGWVTYELRPGYNAHPAPTMHFVAFGNTDDAARQQSAYSTTGYTRYLRGVDSWEIGLDNIAMQLGDLSNLSVYGLELEGYSAYLNNVYFTGLIAQIGQAVADKLPRIDPATGTWLQWDEQAGRMVDSGIKAKGEDGRDGTGDGVAKMLYDDPTFARGRNNTYVYGSNDPNLLRLERVPTGEGNPYPSAHMMRITSNGQCPRGWGGFYFGAPTKANQILIARFVAKIPQGRSIAFITNPLGDNNAHRWLTPNVGTGRWEEYVYYVFAGTGGSFGATMFFYLTGGDTPTPANPLVWHIAYATVYDATSVMAATNDLASAMSIERYINLVETERAAMEATYAKVYALPLLSGTPKTTLLNANTTYKGAADNLLAAVRTAVAGGRTTPAQKADVDAKYNVYKSALISLRIALEEGERAAADAATQISLDLAKYSGGKMLYTDPTFADGDNGVRPYNNAANGLLRIERVAAEQGCPTSSTHMLRVSVTGSTTPGWGGIYFGVVPKHNHIYLVRLLAKVPVGRTLRNPGTRVGSGGSHEWLTTQDGTGRWQEYIYKLTMGDSGVLDSSFYVFLMGGATPSADTPLVWQIASATVYDATDMEAAADAVAEAKAIERYINPVETERAAMEASYAKVYANPLLVGQPKTLLLNANTTYKGAADNLLAAVRAAIADGRTTPAQKADVDAKYNAYKSALISLRVALEEGERAAVDAATQNSLALAKYRGGKMLYTDPTFANGDNGVRPYGSTDTAVLSVERVPTGEGNPYPSTHMMRITSKGVLGRGYGGWHFGTPTKANQILVARIVAKIPAGRSIVFATNVMGDGSAYRWLTSNEGTGKWEDYVYLVQTGASGTFSTTMFFYLQGGDSPTPAAPLVWYVAYATVYDATNLDDVQPTHLPPTPHDPAVTYIGGRNYAAVVYDTNNQWYKAIKDVPAGTPLSNRTYWQPISSMGSVGMQEAYVRSIWANQAFIDRLHAESIMARSIKAGDNPDNPQALIDEHGYGHLAGGALRFDVDGLHMGAFDVDNGNVYIRDTEGNIRVRYSSEAPPSLAELTEASTFTSSLPPASGSLRASMGWTMRGYGRGSLPAADSWHSTLQYNAENWYRWVSNQNIYLDWFDITRLESKLSISAAAGFELGADVMGSVYGCDVYVDLYKGEQMVRRLGMLRHTGTLVRTANMVGAYNVTGLTAGRYRLCLSFTIYVARYDNVYPVVNLTASHKDGKLVSAGGGYRTIGFHDGAWYIAYPDIMLYMSEEEGFHLTSKNNKLNLPGVLCAARIDSSRVARYAWGKFVKKQGSLDPQVDREKDGSYKVHHSIGHENYIPTVTPQGGEPLMVSMLEVKADYFTFKLFNRSGGVAAGAFNYQCIGSNG